ncbi:MAG TPA: UvrD-helicase domain-containing protein [Bacteroidota bacterium]|nr:UvrD-helicase domain-containing protein [Bacteroidota bacterium]
MTFIDDLNPVQREAVQAANGPVMIIAGAGSGKTRVLTYRIAYLIGCGAPASQILALTFTNKAASEMKKRIVDLVGASASAVWMGTFHSMFARILRKESRHLGYSQAFSIYDSDDSLSVIKKSLERLNLSPQQLNPQAVRSRISAAKNKLVSPGELLNQARDYFEEKTSAVYEQYQKILAESNAMDFDDLLVKPVELFTRQPALLERYQRRFKFILIDEFQDTNRAQYEVTKLLGAGHRNICVVGDDAQSIYSFRGADIRNILDFGKDYPECATFRLEQNYRSTKNILSAADRLIRYNTEQLPKNLWTENAPGEPVTLFRCADDQEEGQQVLHALQDEGARRKLDLKDFAVLYRTNAQSRSLEDVLRRAGIPYVIVGGIRFYERREIKDLLAYLRLLVNPRDDASLLRIVNYPVRGIGETTIEHLERFASKFSLPLSEAVLRAKDVPDITDRARSALLRFGSFLSKYNNLRERMSMSELARSLVDELGVLTAFKDERTAESMARWENVQELLSAISEFSEQRPESSLEDFLQEVSLVSDIDTWEGTQNAVTLMTLHASKGLEFPVVFITGLEEGLLPFYSSELDKADLDEERRLFYVGITRAQQKLYLLESRLRYRFGDLTYPSESRFVSEIGVDNLEVHTSRTNRYVHDDTTPAKKNGIRGGEEKLSPGRKDDFYADESPDYESESQESFEMRRGTVVWHEQFGKGTVVSVGGRGDLKKAAVDFENYGLKHLVLKYARLRPG